jgi:hypothetical protein
MIDIDLYNITELLGETCQLNKNEKCLDLPLLHNLIYVNKSTYKGSINRYMREESNMPIKECEVISYLKTKPDRMSMFIIKPSCRSIFCYFVNKDNNTYTAKQRVISFSWDPQCLSNFESESYKTHFMNLFDKLVYDYRNYSSETNVIVTFDIITLYNIVKRRAQCVNIVNTYAQNYVKMMFNNTISNLSEEKLTPILNFYIYFMCESANIGQNENVFLITSEEKANFKLYIDRTCNINKSLIEEIRLFIGRNF